MPDESVVLGLMAMGFSKNRAERAWYNTQGMPASDFYDFFDCEKKRLKEMNIRLY